MTIRVQIIGAMVLFSACARPSSPDIFLSDSIAETSSDVVAGVDTAGDVIGDLTARPETLLDTGYDVVDLDADAADSGDAVCLPDGCCLSDADCPVDQRCVGVSGEDPGVCVRRASMAGDPPFPCWADTDCDEGVPCRNVDIPTCLNPVWHTPGSCLQEGCCLEDGDCVDGFVCWGGNCIPVLAEGSCLNNENCDAVREECVGASPCDCPAGGPNCNGCVEFCTEERGTCVDLAAAGCCRSDLTCEGTGRERCLFVSDSPFDGWRTCVEKQAKGRCWGDYDCMDGMTCVGASVCPCGVDCGLEWEGPGLCVLPDSVCVVVPEVQLSRCIAAGTYRFDGQNCVPCESCCTDGPFGGLVFPDEASCVQACHPGAMCEPWDGDCGGETEPDSWWRFDGTGCVPADDCGTPGEIGVYADAESCDSACVNAELEIDFRSGGGIAGHGFGSLYLRGRTLSYLPVDDADVPCETDLEPYVYRSLFKQSRLVDWPSLKDYYRPPDDACRVDGWSFYLKVSFGGGSGTPVLAETRWCAEAMGYLGAEPVLPDELLPLARWLVDQLDKRSPCE